MMPGRTQLMRMFDSIHSCDNEIVMFSTPALADAECIIPGMPFRFPIVTLTMEPPLSPIHCRYASRHMRKVPVRLVSTTAENPLWLMSALSAMNCPPALLIRMSNFANCSTQNSMQASTSSSFRMFVDGPATTFPRTWANALISSAASTHCPRFLLAMMTVAPRVASSNAIDRPMPVPPPDTNATLPSNRSSRKQLLQSAVLCCVVAFAVAILSSLTAWLGCLSELGFCLSC
mmetsp:Transcript_16834/g.46495  ORF Transcript_16834/g.46495 Transcript_16834/m.46495 type:complete len:232 (+) Transcript_16834:2024-2719(+)